MTTTDIEHASDRLHTDMHDLAASARHIMDSITGAWDCEGRPYIPEMISAVQTIIDATGRLGHAVEKVALEMSNRAPGCYIDSLGERTDATEQIREIAADLLTVGQALRDFPQTAYPRTKRLGNVGERD